MDSITKDMVLQAHIAKYGPITASDIVTQVERSLGSIPDSAAPEKKGAILRLLREFVTALEGEIIRIEAQEPNPNRARFTKSSY